MGELRATPGPWRVGEVRHAGRTQLVMHDGRGFVCEVQTPLGGDPDGLDSARREANAHLIAAAPELYEALDELEAYFEERADAEYTTDTGAPVGNEEMRRLMEIRALLRKARGEA